MHRHQQIKYVVGSLQCRSNKLLAASVAKKLTWCRLLGKFSCNIVKTKAVYISLDWKPAWQRFWAFAVYIGALILADGAGFDQIITQYSPRNRRCGNSLSPARITFNGRWLFALFHENSARGKKCFQWKYLRESSTILFTADFLSFIFFRIQFA